jgi:hypothetical protein
MPEPTYHVWNCPTCGTPNKTRLSPDANPKAPPPAPRCSKCGYRKDMPVHPVPGDAK